MNDPASSFPLPSAHALNVTADLPIPLWLFAWAALLVLFLSFMLLALSWRKPVLSETRWLSLGLGFGPRATGFARATAGAIGVAMLGLTLAAALFGTGSASRSFAVTFVFVTVWVGGAVTSAFAGDLLRPFNPWGALARLGARPAQALRRRPRRRRAVPARWGRWPAVAGVLAFGWLELVLSPTSTGAILAPRTLGLLVLAYTVASLSFCAIFGASRWLERGEFVAVYLSTFGRLSPWACRDGRVGWRGPMRGLVGWAAEAPGSAALAMALIGITTFDGAAEGVLSEPIRATAEGLTHTGLGPTWADRAALSVFLLLSIGFVASIFWLCVAGMGPIRGICPKELGRQFAPALIPVALGYMVAHYFTYLVTQGGAQVTYLLADPLGLGWNPLGLGQAEPRYGPPAGVTWAIQVTALVGGHVAGLAFGHDRALALTESPARATRSQYATLILMTAFTCLGLFLLSQSNR